VQIILRSNAAGQAVDKSNRELVAEHSRKVAEEVAAMLSHHTTMDPAKVSEMLCRNGWLRVRVRD
jgi:hypothetical protein